ncbi:MAG TPA: CBS domain-containing protein [Rhodospirillales bacterium]|nr:CBS domain-containing protein [Rhodospirillales bacterium]|tara:strand:- start:492 stop:908 length:417 start_codon:yes stop_codon:yes gene_type:complete
MSNKKIIKVGEVMTPDVKTIEGTQTVDKAIELMRNSGVSSLIVDRRNIDDEFGMVVVTDIATKVIGPDKAPERVGIYEIMTKPVLTISEGMDIRYAVRLLGQFGISRALVTDKNRHLMGLVTLRDMVLRHADENATRK